MERMEVTFEEAWQRKDTEQAEAAKAFWETHGLLPPQLLRDPRGLDIWRYPF